MLDHVNLGFGITFEGGIISISYVCCTRIYALCFRREGSFNVPLALYIRFIILVSKSKKDGLKSCKCNPFFVRHANDMFRSGVEEPHL